MGSSMIRGSRLWKTTGQFGDFVRRNSIVQALYIVSFCLVYLMENIWLSRTIFLFAVTPIFFISRFPFAGLRPILKSNVFIGIVLFSFLIPVTSVLAGGTPAPLIEDATRYAFMVIAFAIVTADLVREDGEFPRMLMFGIALAATVAAAVDIDVFYSGYSAHLILQTRLGGVQGLSMYYNSNVVGGIYAIPCVGAAAIVASRKLPLWQGVLFFACALILLIAIVLTQSRGSLVAALGGIGVSVLLSANWRQRIVVAALIVLIVAILAATPLLASALHRGDSLRLTLWPIYLKWAALKPWFGYGLAFDPRTTLPDGNEVMNAHNVILCAQIRGGILCAAALVWIIVSALERGWRSWWRLGATAPLALMCACVLATSVDYEILPSELGYPWLIFWLPITMCLGASLRGLTPAEFGKSRAAS